MSFCTLSQIDHPAPLYVSTHQPVVRSVSSSLLRGGVKVTSPAAKNEFPLHGMPKSTAAWVADLRPLEPNYGPNHWEGHVSSPPPAPYEHLERAHTPSLTSPFNHTHPLTVEGEHWDLSGATHAPAVGVRQFSIPPPLPIAPTPNIPLEHPDYFRINVQFGKTPATTVTERIMKQTLSSVGAPGFEAPSPKASTMLSPKTSTADLSSTSQSLAAVASHAETVAAGHGPTTVSRVKKAPTVYQLWGSTQPLCNEALPEKTPAPRSTSMMATAYWRELGLSGPHVDPEKVHSTPEHLSGTLALRATSPTAMSASSAAPLHEVKLQKVPTSLAHHHHSHSLTASASLPVLGTAPTPAATLRGVSTSVALASPPSRQQRVSTKTPTSVSSKHTPHKTSAGSDGGSRHITDHEDAEVEYERRKAAIDAMRHPEAAAGWFSPTHLGKRHSLAPNRRLEIPRHLRSHSSERVSTSVADHDPIQGTRGRTAIEKQLTRMQSSQLDKEHADSLLKAHETHYFGQPPSNLIPDDKSNTYSPSSGRCRSRSVSPSNMPGLKETWRLPAHKSHIVPPVTLRIPVSPLAQSVPELSATASMSSTTNHSVTALVSPAVALSPKSAQRAITGTMSTVSSEHLGAKPSRQTYTRDQKQRKQEQWMKTLPAYQQSPPHRPPKVGALPSLVPPHATTAEKEAVHAGELERANRRAEYAREANEANMQKAAKAAEAEYRRWAAEEEARNKKSCSIM